MNTDLVDRPGGRVALVFANGDLNDGPAVQAAVATAGRAVPAPLVIAADGGARNALACNLIPDLVIGDFDSLTEAELRMLEAQGAAIERHPPEKDATDLELVLLAAASHGCNPIHILGGVGDRLDQTIANIYLLGLPQLQHCEVRLVAGKQTVWLGHPGTTFVNGTPGDTLSLIPLSGAARAITTEGLYYQLRGETLTFGPARGISNVLTAPQASITFTAGILLLIHTLGRA
jgi:thiamine pyrophosphokinase